MPRVRRRATIHVDAAPDVVVAAARRELDLDDDLTGTTETGAAVTVTCATGGGDAGSTATCAGAAWKGVAGAGGWIGTGGGRIGAGAGGSARIASRAPLFSSPSAALAAARPPPRVGAGAEAGDAAAADAPASAGRKASIRSRLISNRPRPRRDPAPEAVVSKDNRCPR